METSPREVLVVSGSADRLPDGCLRAPGLPRQRCPGGTGRRARLSRGVGGRAPRPLRVFALFGARSSAQLHRGADAADPARSRRDAHAVPLQPPDPRRRTDRHARHPLEWARALGQRQERVAHRAGRVRDRSCRAGRAVARGARHDPAHVARRRVRVEGALLQHAADRRDPEAGAASRIRRSSRRARGRNRS